MQGQKPRNIGNLWQSVGENGFCSREYGILDWLVEDVVENGDDVLDHLFALSPLADGSLGDIVVIPAHGRQCNEYIAKMGRAWMHRMDGDTRIPWPQRLHSLLQKLDEQHHPDCILIDTRRTR